MKNGYKLKNNPPQVSIPLSDKEITQIGTACAIPPQERFVAKSCRIQELQKELKQTDELCAQAERLVSMWAQPTQYDGRRNANKLDIRYLTLPYDKYKKDVGNLLEQHIGKILAVADGYVDTMEHHAITLRNTILGLREDLVRAIEVEQKGKMGEDLVETYLADNLDARILSSVILPAVRTNDSDPKTSETDLLVICRHGVFVCEIKNYGKAGQTLEVQPDGQFVKKDYYGRELDYLGNPFKQNAKHHQAVRKVLADAGLGQIPVYPAVIIANTEVNIDNQSAQWVMDMYSFKSAVEQDLGRTEYPEAVLQEIHTALQRKRMGERMFPIPSIDSVAQYYRFAIKQLNAAMAGHARWKQDAEYRVSAWAQQETERWDKKHPIYQLFDFCERTSRVKLVASLCLWLAVLLLLVPWGIKHGILKQVLCFSVFSYMIHSGFSLIEIAIFKKDPQSASSIIIQVLVSILLELLCVLVLILALPLSWF